MNRTTTFFDRHQRATIEAAMARIIPTDDTPGAREAGTVDFLDRYLSGIDYIYAKPDGSGFETLTGRQRATPGSSGSRWPRHKYVDGIATCSTQPGPRAGRRRLRRADADAAGRGADRAGRAGEGIEIDPDLAKPRGAPYGDGTGPATDQRGVRP